MKVISVCIGLVWLVLFYTLFIYGRWSDAKAWNGGICPSCGNQWESFDMDSQGGRGYKCECGSGVWISYAVDVRS